MRFSAVATLAFLSLCIEETQAQPTVSEAPSTAPSTLSIAPSGTPSVSPSESPSNTPSVATISASGSPTAMLSDIPTEMPSAVTVSDSPSAIPSSPPSAIPSSPPSAASVASSSSPTALASSVPSQAPTTTAGPTVTISEVPSSMPSIEPTGAPSVTPIPSGTPTASQFPSQSLIPSSIPSVIPSGLPTVTPAPSLSDAPSAEPSLEPTYFPTLVPPPCYDDINEIFNRETSVRDSSIPRLYIICPQTRIPIGKIAGNGIVGGQLPIIPRANAEYRCGENGSRENNCVLFGGSFQVLFFEGFFPFDDAFDNVIMRGLTFEENTLLTNIRLDNPGGINFIDCVIRRNQNSGPVTILFSPFRRRKRRRLSEGALTANSTEVHQLLLEAVKSHENPEEEEQRKLQAPIPDELLEVKFENCLFEANRAVGIDPGQELPEGIWPGVITVTAAQTTLDVSASIFQDNEYSRRVPLGWAIQTRGPLTIKDNCFINNNFKLHGVVQLLDQAPFSTLNNFGTMDDGLTCQFIALFETPEAFDMGNPVCTDYESQQCALIGSTPNPTMSPAAAPPSGAWGENMRWRIFTTFAAGFAFMFFVL